MSRPCCLRRAWSCAMETSLAPKPCCPLFRTRTEMAVCEMHPCDVKRSLHLTSLLWTSLVWRWTQPLPTRWGFCWSSTLAAHPWYLGLFLWWQTQHSTGVAAAEDNVRAQRAALGLLSSRGVCNLPGPISSLPTRSARSTTAARAERHPLLPNFVTGVSKRGSGARKRNVSMYLSFMSHHDHHDLPLGRKHCWFPKQLFPFSSKCVFACQLQHLQQASSDDYYVKSKVQCF